MEKVRKTIAELDNRVDQVILKIKEKFHLFDPVIIYPYRGYGNNKSATITGRILEKESVLHDDEEGNENLYHQVYKVFKRFETDEIPHVKIEGEFYGEVIESKTDDEGYFSLTFPTEGKSLANGWHEVSLKITEMPYQLEYQKTTTGEVLINNQQNCFGIISDVDDTILKSFSKDTKKKLWTLIRYNASERTPFEGVSELYKGLIANGKNPLFFISSSSYNLYDLLYNFCEHHQIPKAPFLLRNLGLTDEQWFKKGTTDYKKDYIKQLFETYPDIKFILIGDSGQKDPETYLEVYKEFPENLKAIFIRHVGSEERKKEVEGIASQIDVPMLLMDNSSEAMKFAKEKGWIMR